MEKKDKNGLTEKEFLANYQPRKYKQPSVTADIVVMQKKETLKILLIERGGHPYIECLALPGGFANENEPLIETAKRELYEETNLLDLPLEEVGCFSKTNRDPRGWVISFAFVSLIKKTLTPKAGDDANKCSWYDLIVNQKENILELSFVDENNVHKAILEIIKENGINSDVISYKTITSDLAFDHAEIIAKALNKINLI